MAPKSVTPRRPADGVEGLDIREVAYLCGCHPNAVRKIVKDGDLPRSGWAIGSSFLEPPLSGCWRVSRRDQVSSPDLRSSGLVGRRGGCGFSSYVPHPSWRSPTKQRRKTRDEHLLCK